MTCTAVMACPRIHRCAFRPPLPCNVQPLAQNLGFRPYHSGGGGATPRPGTIYRCVKSMLDVLYKFISSYRFQHPKCQGQTVLVHLHDGEQPPPVEWAGVHLRPVRGLCHVFSCLVKHSQQRLIEKSLEVFAHYASSSRSDRCKAPVCVA